MRRRRWPQPMHYVILAAVLVYAVVLVVLSLRFADQATPRP